jgi:4-hydroxy-4-methyl-2-oxoglutarate aldolase
MDLTARLEKLYASAVYDALRAMGHDDCVLPPAIRALNPAHRLAGEVWTIDGHYAEGQGAEETLRSWATVLSKAPAGKVLVCQPNTDAVALMGELSAGCLKTRGVRGYLADGGCRDLDLVLALDWPVYCRFATPKDIVDRWTARELGGAVAIGGVRVNTGDYILGDRDGCVVIPRAMAEEAVRRTEEVAATETDMRKAILSGMDPLAALDKFGKF